MSGSLKVKAMLQMEGADGSSLEIRRFTVGVDSGTDSDLYNRLLTTVRSVFNISDQAGHCNLFWKDEDGDLVQFSTQGELRHAMDNMCDDTLRIYVNTEIIEIGSESESNETEVTRKTKMADRNTEKFNAIRQQVNAEFRTWVRQYVRTWFRQGGEAAAALTDVPEGVPQDFPQWLASFLYHWTTTHPGLTSDGETGMEEERPQGEMLAPPEDLQPVYYQWICFFVRRFTLRHDNLAAFADSDGDEGHHGSEFCHGREHDGCQGKRGGGQGKKGGKTGRHCSSSESEESDCGEKFNAIRQQVPAEFRTWVCQYVRTWFRQGDEAAAALTDVPEGVPQDFPQWLASFLYHWTTTHPGLTSDGETGMEEERPQGEMLALPEGLQPVYYQWICFFVRRFTLRHDNLAAFADSDGDEGHHGSEFWHGREHDGCQGKRGGGQGKKGGKTGRHCSSSESEESDCGEKQYQKVPKEFRQYVRISVNEQHNINDDNPKGNEKTTQTSLSPEVKEFVQQTLLEWHAKLPLKRPRAVAMEMMEEERTLPSGMEKEHFQWLCRFMARWHRRHAGKCDVMICLSSGDTTDDTSEDETEPLGADEGFGQLAHCHGHRRHVRAAMFGHPDWMTGHPPFPMDPRMGQPCGPRAHFSRPPHHHMHGWARPPCPRHGGMGPFGAGRMMYPDHMMGGRMMSPDHRMGCRMMSPDHRMGCRMMSPDHRMGCRTMSPDHRMGCRMSTNHRMGCRMMSPDHMMGCRMSTNHRMDCRMMSPDHRMGCRMMSPDHRMGCRMMSPDHRMGCRMMSPDHRMGCRMMSPDHRRGCRMMFPDHRMGCRMMSPDH